MVVSRHFTSLLTKTSDPTGYYMLGSKADNLNTQLPPASLPTISPTPTGSVYTLNGLPYGDNVLDHPSLEVTLQNAGSTVDFGPTGNYLNEYNEKYNTYLQDQFQKTTDPAWTPLKFGKNIYQFGNPFFTNLDLYNIGRVETTGPTDDNFLRKIWGIKSHASDF